MNKEKQRETTRLYRLNNKDKIKEINRLYRLNNKERIKQYRLDKKERIKEVTKKYLLNNKEHIKLVKKKYYLKNLDKMLSYSKNYNLNNKEKRIKFGKLWRLKNKDYQKIQRLKNPSLAIFYCAKRNAAKLNATPKFANLDKIKEIYKNCPKGYTVDHIVPLQGKEVCGLHVEWNLQYLTPSENSSKSNKLINDYL